MYVARSLRWSSLLSATDAGRALRGEPPVLEPGHSLAWDVFQTQEIRMFDDVSE